MNKPLFLLCLQFILLKVAVGQYQIGGKLGGNYSTFFDRATNNKYTGSYNSDVSFLGALNYKHRKPILVNWGGELSYHQKAAQFDFFFGDENFWIQKVVDYKIDMLHISLLPEFSFGNKIRFFVYCGPTFGHVIRSSVKGNGSSLSALGKKHEWIEEGSAYVDFNGPDLGVKSGLGLEYPIDEKINFFVDSQFGFGIVSLASGSMEHYSSFISTVDKSLSIGMSYVFGKIVDKELPKKINNED